MLEAIKRHIKEDKDLSYTYFNKVFKLYSKDQLVLAVISPNDEAKQAARFCNKQKIPFKFN